MENLDILYEDNDVLLINKPAGLVVNKSQTSPENTLQDLLLKKMKIEIPSFFDTTSDSEFYLRTGIVHRLDKDTSGILVIAKTSSAFEHLQAQFKNREVQKDYIALVFGKLKEDLFEINAPIQRSTVNRLKYAISKEGREAVTKIQKLNEIMIENTVLTFVKASPKTGRTHQIRVHLLALGHPIVGDVIYSSKKNMMSDVANHYGRLMLHAWKLQFNHPITNERIEYIAPIPQQFKECII